jgi:hypothetical protein
MDNGVLDRLLGRGGARSSVNPRFHFFRNPIAPN